MGTTARVLILPGAAIDHNPLLCVPGTPWKPLWRTVDIACREYRMDATTFLAQAAQVV
jgi:hypothetical protein